MQHETYVTGISYLDLEAGKRGNKYLPTATLEVTGRQDSARFTMRLADLNAVQLWTLRQMIEQLFCVKIFAAEVKKDDWEQKLKDYQEFIEFEV